MGTLMRVSALKSRTKCDPDPNCSQTETTWPPPRCSSVGRNPNNPAGPAGTPPRRFPQRARPVPESAPAEAENRLSPRGRGQSGLQSGISSQGAVSTRPPRWGQGSAAANPTGPASRRGAAPPPRLPQGRLSPTPPGGEDPPFPRPAPPGGSFSSAGAGGAVPPPPPPGPPHPNGGAQTPGSERRRRFPPQRLPLAGSRREQQVGAASSLRVSVSVSGEQRG